LRLGIVVAAHRHLHAHRQVVSQGAVAEIAIVIGDNCRTVSGNYKGFLRHFAFPNDSLPGFTTRSYDMNRS
jgi:hypothetical protein